jgi:hypothetical protein
MPDINYASAAPVLRSAADLIDRHGLAAGVLHDLDGCFCAHGALSFAATGRTFWVNSDPLAAAGFPGYSEANSALLALGEFLEIDPSAFRYPEDPAPLVDAKIAAWNDDRADADTVVRAMRKAASRAEDLAHA